MPLSPVIFSIKMEVTDNNNHEKNHLNTTATIN